VLAEFCKLEKAAPTIITTLRQLFSCSLTSCDLWI